MDLANFVAAAVAAAAAILAARWGWIDRPSYLWHFRIRDETAEGKQTVTVFFLGTAVAYNVKVRAVGYLHPVEEMWELRREIRVDSNPIELVTYRSKKDEEKEPDTYVEIAWTTSRPRRRHGQRMNTRSETLEVWRWSWRGLKIQRIPEAPDRKHPRLRPWEYRVVRLSGRWVPVARRPLHEIPGFRPEAD